MIRKRYTLFCWASCEHLMLGVDLELPWSKKYQGVDTGKLWVVYAGFSYMVLNFQGLATTNFW